MLDSLQFPLRQFGQLNMNILEAGLPAALGGIQEEGPVFGVCVAWLSRVLRQQLPQQSKIAQRNKG